MTDMDMRPRAAVILRVNQPPEVVRDFVPTLEAMQAIVGGWIELVRPHPIALRELEEELGVKLGGTVPQGMVRLVVNEEGVLRGLPENEYATDLYPGRLQRAIVGDALVLELD
jgi:8-oxo-dGTP pyrophosphatase MutT (NUDIX family)